MQRDVTKPLNVLDLNMPSALIVDNMVICNKILNKASLRAMVFLNINQKEGLGFKRCPGDVISATTHQCRFKCRYKAISYHQEMVLVAWLEAPHQKVQKDKKHQKTIEL